MNLSIFILLFFAEETARALVAAPDQTSIEPTIVNLVLWLKLFVEITSATILAVGIFLTIYYLTGFFFAAHRKSYTEIRLNLARYLALALEFQLGADILATAISPSWTQIGKLGAIAVIRTALNYFLSREMRQEREMTRAEHQMDDADDKEENL